MAELAALRTYTSKIHDNGDGTLTLEAHVGHVHYRDDAGDLQDVDLRFEDMSTYWRVSKASYRLYVAKDFGASQLIRFDNKFEGASHTIYYEPYGLYWINLDQPSQRQLFRSAISVTGTLVDDHTIRWLNAFGPGIHYQVQLKRSGFTKEVIATAAPQNPPYTNYGVLVIARWSGTGLAVKAMDQPSDWDENGYYDSDQRFEVREAGGSRSYIQRAYARDSADPPHRVSCRVAFEKRQGQLWQAKLLTRAMLEAGTYPIAADTTTSFYAGAGDGFVSYGATATWDTAHDATDGTDVAYTQDWGLDAQSRDQGSTTYIDRAFVPVDTSALPPGASITAATLYLWAVTIINQDNDGNDYLVVVQTSQPDPTQLTTADYDLCGDAINNPTEGSAQLDLTGLSTGQYHSLALNATGIGWIDDAGYTLLGVREGHDCVDDPITDNSRNIMVMSASETTGTSQDPYLEVVYTSGTVYSFSATLAAAITTPDAVVLAIARAMQAVLASAASTSDTAVLGLALELATTLANAASTPDTVILAVARETAAMLAAVATTSTSALAVARAMQAVLASSASTPDTVVLAVARAMAAVLASAGSTPDTVVLAVAREFAAILAGAVATPDTVNLDIVVQLAATMATAASTSTPALAVARAMQAVLASAASTPDSVVLAVAREMAATLASAASTPDAAVLGLALELAATLASSASTPDTVNLDIVVLMSATLAAAAATSDTVVLAVAREMAATMASAASTPDTVVLALALQLAAVLATSASTPDDVDLQILGSVVQMAAVLASAATTPDTVVLAVARSMQAILASTGATPDTVVLAVSRAMQAVLAASATATDSAVLGIAREFAAVLASAASTPDTVNLNMIVEFAATLASAAQTPDDAALAIGRAFSAVMQAQAVTSQSVLGVAYQLAATIASAASTPDDAILAVQVAVLTLAAVLSVTSTTGSPVLRKAPWAITLLDEAYGGLDLQDDSYGELSLQDAAYGGLTITEE